MVDGQRWDRILNAKHLTEWERLLACKDGGFGALFAGLCWPPICIFMFALPCVRLVGDYLCGQSVPERTLGV